MLRRSRATGQRSKQNRVLLVIAKIFSIGIACLTASITHAQDLSAFTTHAYSTTYVENQQSELDALEVEIQNAVNSTVAAQFDYDLDARGKARLTSNFTDITSIELTAKQGTGFDYESGNPFSFSVIGTRKATATNEHVNDRLDITITITDVNEKPEVLPPYNAGTDASNPGRVFYVQRNPNFGPNPIVNAWSVFRDPERINIQFKQCADDFQIVEYANLDDPTEASDARGQILDDANQSGATGTKNCFSAPASGTLPNAHDVKRGGRVVNVDTLGQTIRITPVTASGTERAGVRRAVITFRGWAGVPDDCATTCDAASTIKLSPEAKITVYVKTGQNNGPTFAGGASGFSARVNESIDEDTIVHIGPSSTSVTAWNATDLDNDTIIYRLEGDRASTDCRTMDDGSIVESAVALGSGCAWVRLSEAGNVEVKGKNIDYESAPASKTYRVFLVASDGYNPVDDERVPIDIIVQNVDEGLVFSGSINQISQLVVGRAGRSVDLNDHFTDPDGTPITYTATSTNSNVVSVSLQESILTVNAVGTAGFSSVFITATSGGLSIFEDVPVEVRETNQAPTFVGGVATVNAGRSVSENESSGALVRVPGLRYNDPDGDSITATCRKQRPIRSSR